MRSLGVVAVSAMLLALALAPSALAVDIGGTLPNIAPAISGTTIGSSSYDPVAGSTRSVLVTTVILDGNGCPDMQNGAVTAAIFTSGDVETVAATALAYQSCSGLSATFSGNVPMPFHAAAGTYKVQVSATDAAVSNILASLATAPTFTYTSLVAASLPGSISFGTTLSPGGTSPIASAAVTNTGNAVIDAQVSSTALTLTSPSASIAASNIAYSLASNMASSSALSGTPATISAFDLGSGASSSKTIYTQLTVPSATSQYLPGGAYTGTLTVTVVASS